MLVAADEHGCLEGRIQTPEELDDHDFEATELVAVVDEKDPLAGQLGRVFFRCPPCRSHVERV